MLAPHVDESPSMDARAMYEAATSLFDTPSNPGDDIWSARGAALLARGAVESRIGAMFGTEADPRDVMACVQRLILHYRVPKGIAVRTAWAWAGLSTVGYDDEAAPDLDELRLWLSAVEDFLDATD